MKPFLKKLVEFERKIAQEKGAFTLFALLQRKEYIDDWDLLAAAPWIDNHPCYALDFLISRLQETFTPDQMLIFAAMYTTDAYHPGVQDLADRFPVEHGALRVPAGDYLGRAIRRGYLITAQCDPIASFIPRNATGTPAPHLYIAPTADRRPRSRGS
jgi:hypothetical protein